jgi:hypothetical protein
MMLLAPDKVFNRREFYLSVEILTSKGRPLTNMMSIAKVTLRLRDRILFGI